MATLSETYGTQLRPQFIALIPSNLQLTTNYLTFYPPQPTSIIHYSLSDHKSALYPNEKSSTHCNNHKSDPSAALRWDLAWGGLRVCCCYCSPDLWTLPFEPGSDWLCPTEERPFLQRNKKSACSCSLPPTLFQICISIGNKLNILWPQSWLRPYWPFTEALSPS